MAHRIATLLFISCTLISGCASMSNNSSAIQAQQQEALARWHNCVKQASSKASGEPVEAAADIISNTCEGHRRDVLLSFPESMERELDALLMVRGIRAAALQMAR